MRSTRRWTRCRWLASGCRARETSCTRPLVYLLDAEGTVAYAASAHADLIEELARRM